MSSKNEKKKKTGKTIPLLTENKSDTTRNGQD